MPEILATYAFDDQTMSSSNDPVWAVHRDYATLVAQVTAATGSPVGTWKVSVDGGTTYSDLVVGDAGGTVYAKGGTPTLATGDIFYIPCAGATHVKFVRSSGTSAVIRATATSQVIFGGEAGAIAAQNLIIGAGFEVSVTPTVGTAGYIPGDSIGGILTFASAGAISGRAIAVQRIDIHDLSHQSIPCKVELFGATPAGGTYTDGSPLVYAAADYGTRRGAIVIQGANWANFPTHASPTHSTVTWTGNMPLILSATSLFMLIHSDFTGSLTAGDWIVKVAGVRL